MPPPAGFSAPFSTNGRFYPMNGRKYTMNGKFHGTNENAVIKGCRRADATRFRYTNFRLLYTALQPVYKPRCRIGRKVYIPLPPVYTPTPYTNHAYTALPDSAAARIHPRCIQPCRTGCALLYRRKKAPLWWAGLWGGCCRLFVYTTILRLRVGLLRPSALCPLYFHPRA
jgi:hypothetical protein